MLILVLIHKLICSGSTYINNVVAILSHLCCHYKVTRLISTIIVRHVEVAALQVLLRPQLIRSSLLDRRFKSLERLSFRQFLRQLLSSTMRQPSDAIVNYLIKGLIELHSLMVQVLDGLNKQLLDLSNLRLLCTRVQRLKLLLQTECKRK